MPTSAQNAGPLPAPESERTRVLNQLATEVSEAIAGQGPRVLVVTAGPGAGKTHLLDHLTDGLDLAVRRTRADELAWRLPYAVASDLIGVAAPSPASKDVDHQLDAALERLCENGPQLFVVDDAHNADAASLGVLHRLADSARVLPVTLILARRRLPVRERLARLLAHHQVREWDLPPMNDDELAALTRAGYGAPPDTELLTVLRRSGGNPLHAHSILTDLSARGGLVAGADRLGLTPTVPAAVSASLDSLIREQLALLDSRSVALVRTLAVWGEGATIPDLAAIHTAAPGSLVTPAQSAIDAGIIATTPRGALRFTHDLYSDIAYADLDPALRSVLHSAIAEHHGARGHVQLAAHHYLAAQQHLVVEGQEAQVHDAVRAAHRELTHVPAVAVELLDTASEHLPVDGEPIPPLDLALATALAASRQLTRAAEVAADGLATGAGGDALRAELRHILLLSVLAQGDFARVREIADTALAEPLNGAERAAVTDIANFSALLGGVDPVPAGPYLPDGPNTIGEAVTESLRRFLSGDSPGALELALDAARREYPEGDGIMQTAAEIWPPFFEQFVHGPAAAAQLLDHTLAERATRGSGWITAYLEFVQAGIASAQGQLDDAAAAADSGLEHAAAAGLGWTSTGEGIRAAVDAYRGNFAAAMARLDRFADSGRPNQMGLPLPEHARIHTLELQRKLRPALAAAQRCWNDVVRRDLNGWLPSMAIDFARLARRTGDREFADQIVADLDASEVPGSELRQGPRLLAVALCRGRPAEVLPVAREFAQGAEEAGNLVLAASAWEEAACAAAELGDKAAAREYAQSGLGLTQRMGAAALSRRITTRLRPLGIRIDPSHVRERPRTGWDSLTPTETTIADLIAQGLTGAEISQRLYISNRTVQTHVSHILSKLGLRTRIEIAIAATRRAGLP